MFPHPWNMKRKQDLHAVCPIWVLVLYSIHSWLLYAVREEQALRSSPYREQCGELISKNWFLPGGRAKQNKNYHLFSCFCLLRENRSVAVFKRRGKGRRDDWEGGGLKKISSATHPKKMSRLYCNVNVSIVTIKMLLLCINCVQYFMDQYIFFNWLFLGRHLNCMEAEPTFSCLFYPYRKKTETF